MSDESEATIDLENYRGLIRRMVDLEPNYIHLPRPFPQPPSVYYDGTNDRLAFDNWLHTLLLYFHASMLCGGYYDGVRVSTAANCLTGIARDWFFARVAAPKSSIPYQFEEVVIEMIQVFLALGSRLHPPGPPKYTPGTTARAFYFQLQHWYEMEKTTGTEEQRDSYIEDPFLVGMREAMLEMYSTEGKFIGDWFMTCDMSSVERMLKQTQRMLVVLEERKHEAQEGSQGGRRR